MYQVLEYLQTVKTSASAHHNHPFFQGLEEAYQQAINMLKEDVSLPKVKAILENSSNVMKKVVPTTEGDRRNYYLGFSRGVEEVIFLLQERGFI